MNNIRKILAPVDFSENSRIALDWAMAFADKYDEERITAAPEIGEGKPFVEIIKAAKNYNADLIVMATHGRTGLQSMLIGSVAEKVVRKAPCPVLTIRNKGMMFEMP